MPHTVSNALNKEEDCHCVCVCVWSRTAVPNYSLVTDPDPLVTDPDPLVTDPDEGFYGDSCLDLFSVRR